MKLTSPEGWSHPEEESPAPEINLDDVRALLGRATQQTGCTTHRAGTLDKVHTTYLFALASGESIEHASQGLRLFAEVIACLADDLLAAPDPVAALQTLRDALRAPHGGDALGASPGTVRAALPDLPRAGVSQQVQASYARSQERLSQDHLFSSEICLALDATHERASPHPATKHHSFIRTGGKKTWERGFAYEALFDTTNRLFVDFWHVDQERVARERRAPPEHIQRLQQATARLWEQGIRVRAVHADRGYYEAEGFALAHLHQLQPQAPRGAGPRYITPQILYGREAKIWDILTGPDRGTVWGDEMRFPFYGCTRIAAALDAAGAARRDGHYFFPVAIVVLTSPGKDGGRPPLAALRARAGTVDAELTQVAAALQAAEAAYASFHKARGHGRRPIVYNRVRRRKFINDQDEALYFRCWALHDREVALRAEREDLIHSVHPFVVSLRPGEDPIASSRELHEIAGHYSLRWGIENGFRDLKQHFQVRTRARRVVRRLSHWLLGIVAYNQWQVCRTRERTFHRRKRHWNTVPWDPRRPHIPRRDWLSDAGVCQAGRYLLRAVREQLTRRLKHLVRGG